MDSRSPSTMFLFSLLALQTPIQAPHKYWGFSTLQMHYFTFFFFSWYFGQKPLFATQHLTKTHLINCKKNNKLMQTEGKKILRWLQPLCNPYSVQCNLAPQCNQCVIVRPPPQRITERGKIATICCQNDPGGSSYFPLPRNCRFPQVLQIPAGKTWEEFATVTEFARKQGEKAQEWVPEKAWCTNAHLLPPHCSFFLLIYLKAMKNI